MSVGLFTAKADNIKIAELNWQTGSMIAYIDSYIIKHGYGHDTEIVPGGIDATIESMLATGSPNIVGEMWISSLGDNALSALNDGTLISVTDDKGDVRKIIFQSSVSSAYTLVAADAGKAVATNGYGITIPNNIFAAGDAVTIVNNSASDVTITRAITNLYLGSDGVNSASLTLKARTTATVFFSSANHGYISGGGLS